MHASVLTSPSPHTMFKICLDPLSEHSKYNYMIEPNTLVTMLRSQWALLLHCLELSDISKVDMDLIQDFLHQVAKEFCLFDPSPLDADACQLQGYHPITGIL